MNITERMARFRNCSS